MKKRGWSKSGLVFILSFSLLLFASLAVKAEEAKYIYDDLGRLYRVIDEQGNAATYHYDEVGNLLSITRETGVTGPQITSISPNYAFEGDTVNVTITGNGLIGASVSTNNPGISISNVIAADISITATFSISYYANQGTALVTVKNALGSSSANFIVNPASPIISALQPSSGPVTRFVTIVGTGFSPTLSENQVRFNGVTAEISSSTPYRILTRVPAGATSGPVTVTTNAGTSNGVIFTVTSPAGPPPTITSITPNTGSEDGGSIVTINGTGFILGTRIYIGGDEVQNVIIISSTSLNVITPAGIAGPADVLLTNDYGDAFVSGGFTYIEGPTQQILAINPTMGLINIPINTRISALFVSPIDHATVNTTSFSLVETTSGTSVAGSFSFDFGDTFIGFTPATNLKPNTSYTLWITRDIKGQNGIPLNRPFSGGFITAASVDTISPTVSVSPANGATGVPVNTLIIMTFSEPMSATTINSSTITVAENGIPKLGILSIGNQNKTATFTPLSDFAQDSSVITTLSQKITDVAGNRIVGSGGVGTDLVSSFTTTSTNDLVPPWVININPPNQATGINVTTTVSVTFSEPVNPLTVNSGTFTLSSGGTNLTGQIAFSGGDTVATFIPDQALPQMTTITVNLAQGISDTAGNGMPLPFTSIFTTGMTIDNYQPSVIQVNPYCSQAGVPLNSDITLVFDERIDSTSVNSSSFYVTCYECGWRSISGSISVSSDGLKATLTPSEPLFPNVGYYIYYTNGITDVAGNGLYNPGYIWFTTGVALANTIPPQILDISPVNGAKNLPVNTQILIRFSENLDWTTVNASSVSVSAGGVPVNTQLTYSENILRIQVANLNTFAANTFYEVRVTTGVKDTAGNPLAQEFVSGFTTGNASDTTPPDIVSIVPADYSSGVSPDTSVEVTFTEPINPLTVNSSTLRFYYFGAGNFYYDTYTEGTYTFSPDKKKMTFTPAYPLFAGYTYYMAVQSIEDLAGNKLPPYGAWPNTSWYWFITAFSPGTDPNSLPTGAVVVVNPSTLFADGISTATVEITNINRNGTLVPNGTKIAVSATSGTILGGTDSPDSRFRVFTTIGGAVTLTYRSPNISWLNPGSSANIYVASADAGNRLVNYINTNVGVTLFGGNSVSIDVNPASLLANGSSYSEVSLTIYDVDSKPVPSGMRIGVTAEPVYRGDSLGGTIQGGEVAPDSRFKIFRTITGGTVSFNYTSPALAASQSGTGWIQVVEVDDTGQVVGLMGSASVSLSGSAGYTAPQPRIVSVSPANGQSGVGLNVPVVAEFSQSLDPATVTGDNFSIWKGGYSVSGSLSLSSGIYGSNTVVTFIPTNPWAPNTSYAVYIGTGIKSSSGNPLLQYSYTSFSTGIALDNQAPYVVRVNPENGLTGVATNNVVTVQFSKPMAPSTINRLSFRLSDSSGDVAGRVVMNSTTNFSFIPDSLLSSNTQYTVTVDGSVTDIAGNHLTSVFTSAFTTQSGQDNYQPSVVQVNPYNGQQGVPLNSDITIVFDERIDPMSVNSSSFYTQCYVSYIGWQGVAGTISVASDGLSATFLPSRPLLPSATCYIYYTNGIKDITGNVLYNPGSSGFATGVALADTTPPQVLDINPVNGATGLPINADILIQFSKVVDQTTVNGNTLIVSTGGVPLAGTLSFEQGGQVVRYVVANLYTFAPNSSYQVRVTRGVTDTAGNPLAQEFVSGFTTGGVLDTTPPDVASIVPANGAMDVSPDTSIEVTFTEPINPLTVNSSTFLLSRGYYGYGYFVSGAYIISPDWKKVTFTPDDPLFAGYQFFSPYYLITLQNVEDLSGNRLSPRSYYFATALAPGTDVNTLPTSAAVVVNPNRLFADGISTTTVEISNINRSGVLVPNGTRIGVSAANVFRLDSIGGTTIGGIDSPDHRVKIFTTIGGKVTLTYQSPNLDSLTPGAYATAYVQVASVDTEDRVVNQIGTGTMTLFRGKNAVVDVNPIYLLSNGGSYSEVSIQVYDVDSKPVPPGVRIGVTAEPVYRGDSLGGTVQGGEAAVDPRFKIFRTITGGTVSFNYTSPALSSSQSGNGWIQVVEVDDTGQVVGLIGVGGIVLSGSTGYMVPQPQVISVSPMNGQTGVSLNTPVVAEFSQSLDPTTVTSDNFSITIGGYSVPGSLSLSSGINGSNTIITFTPTNSWAPNASYVVYIGGGIKSTSGNPLLNYSYNYFSTGIFSDNQAPYVVGVNPPNGVTEVATNNVVTVWFNEAIAPSTINLLSFRLSDSSGDIAGRVSGSTTVFNFIPDSLLTPNTLYTLTIDTTVTDIAGNHLAQAFSSTFATGAGQDSCQPSVIQVNPYNGQTGVPLNSDITLVFDERINPMTVNSSSFYIQCYVSYIGSQGVTGTISVSSDGLSATLTPSRPLLPSASCTIYYENGIKDIVGNVLYNPGSSGFTTGVALADTTPPRVLDINPVNGATGLPINADILIQFSKVVDQTTVNGNTLTVSTGGVPLAGTLSFEQGGQVVRYVVANLYTFAPNTSYQVRVTRGVTDTAGNPLAQEFVSGFTTGGALDTTPPGIVSIVPANYASGVSLDTSIEVTFSEPINPLTVNSSTFVLYYRNVYLSPYFYGYGAYVYGTYTFSPDNKTVTFTPTYQLFGGTYYYFIGLQNIEDLAGNKLPPVSSGSYYFSTGYSPGTDPNSFPTGAIVVVNPNNLFADGVSTATVEITNISRNGLLVPNGTRIAVTAEAAFRGDSIGGSILGGVDSPDSRFKIFTAIGGAVTLTYQSPHLDSFAPGTSANAYIQVAIVDAEGRPANPMSIATVTLFRGKNAVVDINPVYLLANGSSYSEVQVQVYSGGTYDVDSPPVPSGVRIGVTAEPVYRGDSLGGTIQGGEAAADPRFKIFTTITGGWFSFNYTSPALSSAQSGTAWIQVVEVDDTGQVVGLMGSASVSLSGSAGYTAPQPRIVSVSPANGQTGVSLNTPVVAEFSQSLDPTTVTSDNFSITTGGQPVSGTLTLSSGINGSNTIVTFTPTNPWAPNTSYAVYIGTGITGSSGNPLLQYSYTSFSTGIALDNQAPYVIGVNPADGLTGVATNAIVTVQFNKPMAPSTINGSSFRVSNSSGGIAGRVVMNSVTTFSFIPDALLSPNTQYSVTIDTTVTDIAGNHLTSAFTSTFTTQTGVDNYQPSVETFSPGGAIDVPVNSKYIITFNKPMNPLTLNLSNLIPYYFIGPAWYSWQQVPSTITLSNNNTVATVVPLYPLFAGSTYGVFITTDVKDVAGNPLPSQFNSAFATEIASGTTNLPTSATITINPRSLFANGQIATTVIVSNVNQNGVPVPNGTLIGVTAEPAFNQGSVGGVISGNSVGTSLDSRFLLFSTEGAGFTLFYTPPVLDWLTPWAGGAGVIQVASVDLDGRPVSLIAQDYVSLFSAYTASVATDPNTLPADASSLSNIDVMLKDNLGNPVPDGTKIGITVAPVFVADSAGGTIIGGTQSGADYRVKTFNTAGGHVTLTYQAPSSRGPGYAIIQAVTVNNQGAPTGLLGSATINLN